MEALPQKKFVRDNATWLCYMLMAGTSCIMATMGPIMPFLRGELHVDLKVAAYHFSASSLGGLLAGCFGDRVIRKFGRFYSIWACAAIICLALLVIVSIPNPVFTIGGAFFGGMASSIISQCVNSFMSDRFGNERAIAITEGTIIASLVCAAAPLAVKGCIDYGLGWRGGMYLIIALFIVMFLTNRNIPQEYAAPQKTSQLADGGKLPAAYWAYWSVIVLNVACEWSMVFWSAEFLQQIGGLQKSDASGAVTSFLAAMVVGRLIGRKLSERYATQTLLPYAAALAIAGFATFWLGRLPAINIAGLFLTGLGISNFYPLTLAAALGVAQDNSATASARISMGTGFSVLLAPLALATVADMFPNGLFVAYGIVGGLLIVCAAMVFVANHFARIHAGEMKESLITPAAS